MKGTVKVTVTSNIRLMYLNILINRKSIIEIVDTGVIHDFILVEDVSKLGLIFENEKLCMKVPKVEIKPMYKVAQDVVTKIESWLMNVKFLMALMDNFNMILGMKLKCKVKIILISQLMTI